MRSRWMQGQDLVAILGCGGEESRGRLVHHFSSCGTKGKGRSEGEIRAPVPEWWVLCAVGSALPTSQGDLRTAEQEDIRAGLCPSCAPGCLRSSLWLIGS